jgi:hypothetical protein
MALGNFTNYWFRVAPSSSYTCMYHYLLNGSHTSGTIFSFQAPQKTLSPVLQRPVGNSNFMVHYNPGSPNPNVNKCTVQVTANAPNGNVTGDTVSQGGNIYTGSDSSSLNGLGNIVMTRTCIPINHPPHNAPECQCNGSPKAFDFDAVKVTYTSTASYEVSWVPPGSPKQGTNS